MSEIRGVDQADRLIKKRRLSREKTADGALESIRSLFGAGDNYGRTRVSTDPLYNTFSLAAATMGLSVVPFHRLNDAYDGTYTVADIARLSHIPCRKVVFDESFHRNLFGTYIVFDSETGEPAALIPDGKHYLLYKTDLTATRVTKATAKSLKPYGYALYETLPDRELTGREVMRFFIRGTSQGDKKWFVLFTVISLAIAILLPYISAVFYDYLIPMRDVSLMVQSLTVAGFCILAGYMFSVSGRVLLYRMMSRGEYRLKAALLDRVFRLPPQIYSQYDSSDLTSRAMELPEMMRDTMTRIIRALLGLAFSVVYLILLLRIGVGDTLVCLGCLALVTLVSLLIGLRQRRRAVYIKNEEVKAQTFLYHMINGITKLRTSKSENQALNSYMNLYAEPMGIRMRAERARGSAHILRLVASTLIVFLLIFFAYGDDYSVGEYVAFITLFSMLSAAVFYALDQMMESFVRQPVYDRAAVLLKIVPETGSRVLVPKPFVGRIRAEGLHFTYPGSERSVLRGITFDVEPGEYIGIVGASGCGKSTLLRLLLGFLTQEEGRVYYDGLDLEYLDKKELRRRMGVVLQDGNLIAGTIAENVALTKPEATEEEILEVLDKVGMTEDINQMPMGIRTLLSEMSETVSGGQRQRILIARAILSGPRVLFMDEATSALDNRSQQKVSEALAGLNMTRIVIAHRLSTVRQCDRILVLQDGVVAQAGTFEELMAEEGYFRKMAGRQLL